jgi:hypothetical protein
LQPLPLTAVTTCIRLGGHLRLRILTCPH